MHFLFYIIYQVDDAPLHQAKAINLIFSIFFFLNFNANATKFLLAMK